jgi:hypothetical protein
MGELCALRLSSQIAPCGTIVFEIEPPHTPHLGIGSLAVVLIDTTREANLGVNPAISRACNILEGVTCWVIF